MSNETQETLIKVLETVLEQFAFAFCELVPKDELDTADTVFIQSSLTFTGPKSGELSLTMPDELCAEIAGNILGMEDDDRDVTEYAQDSLQELLNVYLGNVLTALYGEEVLFDFGTPDIMRLDDSEWQYLLNDPFSLGVLIEDTPAILRFIVSE